MFFLGEGDIFAPLCIKICEQKRFLEQLRKGGGPSSSREDFFSLAIYESSRYSGDQGGHCFGKTSSASDR